MNTTPAVSIVGRPNVGKSTIFNRLVGRKQAIVHDQPGVTRDRNIAEAPLEADWPVHWIDTGGLMFDDDPLGLNRQVRSAIDESDLVLLVVDGREGLVPADLRIVEELRPLGKKVLLLVNKGESQRVAQGLGEFYALGYPDPILVSAEHGLGFDELRSRIRKVLSKPVVASAGSEAPPVAIVGRPNVGKSSLLNRILGENRVLVSPVAGTTRDPIDTLVERDGKRFLFIDTAGIRRRAKVSGTPEDLAVLFAKRQVERADVAVLVVEAQSGVTSSDLAIAGAIWEAGRAAVVVVNKWDLLDDLSRERLEASWPRLEEILAGPPRINLSALHGRGVEKLFPAVERSLAKFRTHMTTGELNRLLEEALAAHSPPTVNHRPWKVFYSAQVSSGPPTFMVFANRTLPHSHPYRRYLENRLRAKMELEGIPVRLVIRARTNAPRTQDPHREGEPKRAPAKKEPEARDTRRKERLKKEPRKKGPGKEPRRKKTPQKKARP
jgi:GTP-binding protein